MGSTNEHFQEQQLARSYSFELHRNNFMLPTVDNISPAVRYPTVQQRNTKEKSSSINALVNSAMIGSQVSLSNRKVLLFRI